MTALEIGPRGTFLVGENGSGKSTLLEGIAAAAGLPAVGSESVDRDATLEAQRLLGQALTLTWKRRTRRGFFLRAEDFFGFTKSLSKLRTELLERIDDLEGEYQDRSAYAKRLAQMPVRASLADMERRYGVDLDENSHGQSFLKLFQSRFVPGGLYLLDEPEAPLSPQSQLALMAMIGDMLRDDAQFIIATHSPILSGARQLDDREQNDEQHDGADDQAEVGRSRVGAKGMRLGLMFAHRIRCLYSLTCSRVYAFTRTEFMTSFFCSFFITSSPFVILPKTVCTPFRCRAFSSLSTMKN